MTDGQWLFTVFAALYLLECLRWLPATAFVLTGYGEAWTLRRPWTVFEIAKARLFVLPVLPPMQAHLVMQPWLFIPCETGLACSDPEGNRSALIPWSDIAPSADGVKLQISPLHQVRLPDEAAAGAWKERLLLWGKMTQPAREKDFLKVARQSLDVRAVSGMATQITQETRWLRRLAMLIFLWSFGVITLIYRWLGDGPAVIAAAAVLLGLLWTQALLFFRAAGRAPTGLTHRFWKTVAVAFLPQYAMRAADFICRAHSRPAHPLGAKNLMAVTDWQKVAARFWKHAVHREDASAALQKKALELFFREQSITPEDLEELPMRQPGAAAYCPNCHGQFTDAGVTCQDCGGVALKSWPEVQA